MVLMRKYIFLLLTSVLFAGAGCENDNETDPNLISEIDRQFILAASDDALYQVNAGQIAASGTTMKTIRDYGEQITTDQTQAGQELLKLAAARQVEIPTTLSDDRQQQLDSLSMLKGASLDTLYLDQMVAIQERVVHMMEIEGTSGNDLELKQWATNRLPATRQFEERVKAMRDSLD